MAFDIPRLDRRYRYYDVAAAMPNGDPATLDGVSVALLPPRTPPDETTVWTTAEYVGEVVTVLLAGPEADDTDATLVVPDGGADLWIRVVDEPEVMTARVERISVT